MNESRTARLFLATAVVVVGALFLFSRPAAAHTDFESSTPADGAVVETPVAEIVIRFTGESTPAGDGFTVRDPSGTIRSPSSISTADNKVFVLEFEPALLGGTVGVRWSVQAQDSHPIEGAFSFTVASASTTVPTAPTTAPPAPTTVEPDTTPVTTEAESPPSTESVDEPEAAATSDPAGSPTAGDGETPAPTLEEFLAIDSSTPGDGRQLAGRIGSLIGVVGIIGGLAFLTFTLRGSRRELAGVLVTVGALAFVTTVAAAVEFWGRLAASEGSIGDELSASPGAAMGLRFLGGAVVAAAVLTDVRRPVEPTARDTSPNLSAATATASPARPTHRANFGRSWRDAPLVPAGVGLLIGSFWFDGHTVSKGPRLLHAAVNSVHVLAAGVWAGGVVALLVVLALRHRRAQPPRAAELVVRFSSVATVALVAVVLAGAVMAVLVLESPGDLTSTEWGKTLLLKSAAVGIAAVAGAFNHFVLRPRLEATPDSPKLTAELRTSLLVESIVLTFVVIVTAWLVAAAT